VNDKYPISASQLKKWKRCPKSYEYGYIKEKEETRLSIGYLEVGSAVHETIEEVLTERNNVTDRSTLEYWFDRVYEEGTNENRWGVPQSMKSKGTKALQNAAKFVAEEDIDIVGVEEDCTFRVNRNDIDHPFRGIIDIVTPTGIIDWKTGSKRPEDEMIQAGVYIAAFTHKYHRVPESVTFVYLKDQLDTTVLQSQWDGQENPLWGDVIAYAKRLLQAKAKNEWPAKPSSSTCYWCDYKGYCVDSKIGVEEVDYRKLLW